MHNSPQRILVIDDEACVRDILEEFLAEHGYQVTTAATPESCPVFHDHDCDKDRACADVIIVDQKMPGTSGLAFLRDQQARGCKARPEHKLVMTASILPETRAAADALGCVLLQKPFDLDDILAFVQDAERHLGSDQP